MIFYLQQIAANMLSELLYVILGGKGTIGYSLLIHLGVCLKVHHPIFILSRIRRYFLTSYGCQKHTTAHARTHTNNLFHYVRYSALSARSFCGEGVCSLWLSKPTFYISFEKVLAFRSLPWFERLVASLSPWRYGFEPWPVHVRLLVDTVALARTGLLPSTSAFASYNNPTDSPCSYSS